MRKTQRLRLSQTTDSARDTCGIKLLNTHSKTRLMLVKEDLKECRLSMGDLLHYAGATSLNADYLASWNTDDFNPASRKL